ncbi:hypothetical protein [Bradyrhizobium commune]|uniref:Uncharacterized protein n=1 Tax=Bradyrhizobium commune TaxID=83627 RepID=A0A7S9GWR2_9BRAD|nr:hypothetical protein [Bradyrhizobium commune]QPF88649.1 hypothetical protein IC761_19140 [Bradyrhizobium commune]
MNWLIGSRMTAHQSSISSHFRVCEMTMKGLIAVAMMSLMSIPPAVAQMPPDMPPDGPMLEMVAGMVIQKYKSSGCDDLKAKKGEPPAEIVAAAVGFLRSNPSLRVKFINKVAAPVANKMFDCGMIP